MWSQRQQLRLVPGLGAETSTEIHAQLFVVLSFLTDSESFDVVMSAGSDHGFESWRKLHRRYESVHSGTCTKSLEGDSVADRE